MVILPVVSLILSLVALALAILNNIKIKKIMSDQSDLVAKLQGVLAQQKKTALEITGVQTEVTTLQAKVAELQAIVDQGGTITQELKDAVQAVADQSQVVDDEIPDTTTPPDTSDTDPNQE